MTWDRRMHWAIGAGIGALLLFLGTFQANYVYSNGPLYDDGYNASVAKNIAFGYGNVTSYHELIRDNPEVTTGPTLILPLAALIFFVGNTYWAPSLILVLMSFGLTLLFFYLVRKQIGSDTKTLLAAGLFLFFIVFASTEASNIQEVWFPMRLWLQFLGEIPAVLFFVLGMLYFSGPKRDLLKAGVLWGLALHCKVIVLIPIVGVLLLSFLYDFRGKLRVFLGGLKPLWWGLFFVKAFFLTVLLVLPRKDAVGLTFKHFLDFIKIGGSGVGQIEKKQNFFLAVLEIFKQNVVVLTQYLGGLGGMAAFLGVLILGFYLAWKTRKQIRLAHYLFFGGLLHLAWWLSLSSHGWARHLMPALFVLVLGLLLLAAQVKWRFAGGVFVLVGLLGVVKLWGSLPSAHFDFRKSERLAALQETAAYLTRLREDPQAVLLGCGWWAHRDLEYLMPGVLNFHDCLKVKFDEVKKYYLVRSSYWNWGRDMAIDRFFSGCEASPIFSQGEFEVRTCLNLK